MLDEIKKAFQLIENDRIEEAADIFQNLVSIETDNVEEVAELGRLALFLGETLFAIRTLTKAVELAPESVDCLFLLSLALREVDRLEGASTLCEKAVKIDPERYQPYLILGEYAAANQDYMGAVAHFSRARDLKPTGPDAYANLVMCYRALGDYEQAQKYAEKFVKIDPGVTSYLALSVVLIDLGKKKEALLNLEKARKIDNKSGYVFYTLALTKKVSNVEDKLIQYTEKVLKESLPSKHRGLIHFGLGKMYGECKEWDKSFEHYRQGNLLLKDANRPFGIKERFKQAKKIYNNSFIKNDDLYGSNSNIPVFIVGMPRSGTTLMEQVIAAHPQGEGAGELIKISRIHNRIFSGEDSIRAAEDQDALPVKDIKNNLSKDALEEYAHNYMEMLSKTREGSVRIVDKLPDNYIFLGLMYKLFPNAYFINAMRNPLDTCLSCFFQHLEGVPDTFDLEWIGQRYVVYRKAIEYWRHLLPEGKILDVSYDLLVQDFEGQSRRIIDYCELPWDERCLEFYKNDRPVATASVWQVREPVYKTSSKRWVNYAKHLGPLANQISEYLDDEDIAELEKHGVKVKKKLGFGFLKSARN